MRVRILADAALASRGFNLTKNIRSESPDLLMNGGLEGEKAEGGGQTAEMRAGEMSDLISRAKEIIEGMKASTLKRDKARMLQLLEPG